MNAPLPASVAATADGLPQLTAAEDRLVHYLSAGATQRAAGLAAGFSDSEVSELLLVPHIAAALELRRAATLETRLAHDDSIEAVERRALKVLDEKLLFVKSAGEAAKVFQILNNAKKSSQAASEAAKSGDVAVSVTLQLPAAAVVQFAVNKQNQMIEVAGRALAPLPSKVLPQLAAERKQQQEAARELQLQRDKEAALEALTAVATPLAVKPAAVMAVPGLAT